MKTSLEINWLEGMAFESDVNGHKMVIDAVEAVGGNDRGPRPKPLMLLAVAGCTGMDIVAILKKMRVELNNFKVEVEANQTEEHPKHFNEMKIIYKFWGEELANIVGTATESVIRLLSEFKHDRLIDLNGRKITILDIKALEKISNAFN